MSHISKIELKVTNLDSLAKASDTLGGSLVRNVNNFKYYGNMFGADHVNTKCDHVIRFPKASYEIGVVKQKEKEFELKCDYFSSGGLPQYVGQNGGKLKQQYALEETKRVAMLRGMSTKITKDIKDGNRTKTRIEMYVKE